MQSITFTCEVITPMFLAGADGTTPELRPASIKGALRFWWRAMNGHLEWKEMAKLEGKIFGDTKQRSSLIIMIEETIHYNGVSKSPMLPHKKIERESSITPCFPVSNQQFKVRLSLTNEASGLKFEQMKSLFILTCVLGGLGKRSRRGFGSVNIVAFDDVINNSIDRLESILVLLNTFRDDKYEIREGVIKSKNARLDLNQFPYITEIKIGNDTKTVDDIGAATHSTMSSDPYNYKSTIGAGKPRFASPIYISVLKNQKPIITTLNTVSSGSKNWNLQTDLKNKLV